MYGTNYAQIIFQPSTSSVTVIVNLSDHVGILDHWRWMSLVCWNYLVSSLPLDNRFLVLLLEQMMTKLKRRNKNKSSRIRCSLVWSGVTMHWWYADDALMICWWCTDDALIMHYWCADDALMKILPKVPVFKGPKMLLLMPKQKRRPSFNANIPPKWWITCLFYAFTTVGWVLSQFFEFGPFGALFPL